MIIEQIYTGCLAQGAYYIESAGEVAIIDPLRSVQVYIDKAESNNAKIKYVFETHFHADFVSGHVTLADKTGAPIIYGPNANPSFDATIAKDLQEFRLGEITIVVLHTPGHTMESTTYLLRDENGKDVALFSGDTLFLGDVGRPDLAQKAADMTQEDLAGILFDSLRNKIMPLPDDIMVYPAHGAGSACGKNMMKETVDTLGNQKKMNYALRADMTKAEFINEVTDGLTAPPAYFPINVKLNKEGYTDFDKVLQRGNQGLNPREFELAASETHAVVLDVRHQDKFVKEHIPRSIFIGLNGSFAPWVGSLIVDVNQEILIIAEEGQIEEAITRLSRVGFDNVLGYLQGGVDAWKKEGFEIDSVPSIPASQLADLYEKDNSVAIVDVRRDGEYTAEHIENAQSLPLSTLSNSIASMPESTAYIHCAGGYRSVIASSILKSKGIHNLVNIEGGYKEIGNTTLPRTAFVCPSTLK